MSGNRKYSQLHIDDLKRLRELLVVALALVPLQMYGPDQRLVYAIDEAIVKAEENPNSSICLAYAVARKAR